MGADAGHKRRMQESGKKEREAMLAQENRLSAKRVKEAKLKQKAMRKAADNEQLESQINELNKAVNDRMSVHDIKGNHEHNISDRDS